MPIHHCRDQRRDVVAVTGVQWGQVAIGDFIPVFGDVMILESFAMEGARRGEEL